MPKLKPGTTRPSPSEDAAINVGIAADTDSPEWTEADFVNAQPAKAIFDPVTFAALESLRKRQGERGLQKSPTKMATTIRLSPEVMEAFKSTGQGWQTRIDSALKDWLKTHSPASKDLSPPAPRS